MPKSNRTAWRSENQARQAPQRSEEQTTGASTAVKTGGQPYGRPYQPRELSRRTQIISLVVGDILCFLIFATLGMESHSQGLDLLYSFWVALPFMAGWFIVAPWVGAYRADIVKRPRAMLGRTLLCWVTAWPVAMGLRWLVVDRVTGVTASAFFSFAVVALFANAIILNVWRWPFALNNDMRTRTFPR